VQLEFVHLSLNRHGIVAVIFTCRIMLLKKMLQISQAWVGNDFSMENLYGFYIGICLLHWYDVYYRIYSVFSNMSAKRPKKVLGVDR
jgi:hypothetical protein